MNMTKKILSVCFIKLNQSQILYDFNFELIEVAHRFFARTFKFISNLINVPTEVFFIQIVVCKTVCRKENIQYFDIEHMDGSGVPGTMYRITLLRGKNVQHGKVVGQMVAEHSIKCQFVSCIINN